MNVQGTIQRARRQVYREVGRAKSAKADKPQTVRDLLELGDDSRRRSADQDRRETVDRTRRKEVTTSLRALSVDLDALDLYLDPVRDDHDILTQLRNAKLALSAAAEIERSPGKAKLDPGDKAFMRPYVQQQSALHAASWISNVANELDRYPEARVPKLREVALEMVKTHDLKSYAKRLEAPVYGDGPVSDLLGDLQIFKDHPSLVGLRLPAVLTEMAEKMKAGEIPGGKMRARKLLRAAKEIEESRGLHGVALSDLGMTLLGPKMPRDNPLYDMLADLGSAQLWAEAVRRIGFDATA